MVPRRLRYCRLRWGNAPQNPLWPDSRATLLSRVARRQCTVGSRQRFERHYPEGILKHIRGLASDEYEGRARRSAGEAKTLDYIVARCRAMKLTPGNPDGTCPQPVPSAACSAVGNRVLG